MDKQQIKDREKELIELTAKFCGEKLESKEYAELCAKLIKKMGRKRNVPFERGRIEIWAASIVHAIGSINFLFDKSFEPYVRADEISEYFGTKKKTTGTKANSIIDLMGLQHFDSEFSTKAMVESNPFNNMVMVDGFIVPLKNLPEELQEQVREARANGKDIEFFTSDE